jgi:hypothetical protein
MDDEFQEADVLWPDVTPRDEAVLLPFAPSEPYEAVSAVSRCVPAFGLAAGRHFEGSSFSHAGAQSSSSPDTTDDEEWQEADVLWPDTVDEPWRGVGGSPWSFRGGFGPAGRCVETATPRDERWAPGVSSPIDIPANVSARRIVGAAAMGRRL